MCDLCRLSQRLDSGDILQLIGQRMATATGKTKAHLLSIVDRLADDDFEPHEDPELAAEWERYRRGE